MNWFKVLDTAVTIAFVAIAAMNMHALYKQDKEHKDSK